MRSPENKQTKKRGRPQVEGLTPKQRETFRAVRSFLAHWGYSPTIQELATMLGVTVPTAFASVSQIVRKGFFKREAKKRRGIFIARIPQEDVAEHIDLPVLSRLRRGALDFSDQNVSGRIAVDKYLIRNGQHFGFRIADDSMTDAGLREGDTVIVHQQPLAEDRDFVVVLLGEEPLIRRLSYTPYRIELRPESSEYQPIVIDEELAPAFRIVGRVVSMIRR